MPPTVAPAWLTLGGGAGVRGGYFAWHAGGWVAPGRIAVGLRQSGIVPDDRVDSPLETSAFVGWHHRGVTSTVVVAAGVTLFSIKDQSIGCGNNCRRQFLAQAAPAMTIEASNGRDATGVGLAFSAIGGEYGYASATIILRIMLSERRR